VRSERGMNADADANAGVEPVEHDAKKRSRCDRDISPT